MTLGFREPVPVVVLTGFLGAGKTTLLNGLLRLPALAQTAVIVNEFGDIGVDHLLVDHVDGDMLMLTTGCVCCAARGDLVTALEALFGRRQRGEVTFRRIMIETTGLADPGPVLNALLPVADPDAACRLERVVTVVDAHAGVEILEHSAEARRQVALADLLVLSKTDLPDADHAATRAGLVQQLKVLNPVAPVLTTGDPAFVCKALLALPPVDVRAAVPVDHHPHLHGIHTVALRAGAIDPHRFEAFLDRLLVRQGADLLRLKRFLAVRGDLERPILVNVVQHRIHPASRLAAWPDQDRNTRLVVIAKGEGAEAARDLWDTFFGPPQIDRADAHAVPGGHDARPGLF